MTLTARAQFVLSATELAALDLSTLRNDLAQSHSKSWSFGTGNDQINALFADQRQLAASATEDLDLAGGTLTDAFGNPLTMTKVKAIYVRALDTNDAANAVRVARHATAGIPIFTAASDAVDLPPDGEFYRSAPKAGITITPTTGDQITITNTAGTNPVDYHIIILGTK